VTIRGWPKSAIGVKLLIYSDVRHSIWAQDRPGAGQRIDTDYFPPGVPAGDGKRQKTRLFIFTVREKKKD